MADDSSFTRSPGDRSGLRAVSWQYSGTCLRGLLRMSSWELWTGRTLIHRRDSRVSITYAKICPAFCCPRPRCERFVLLRTECLLFSLPAANTCYPAPAASGVPASRVLFPHAKRRCVIMSRRFASFDQSSSGRFRPGKWALDKVCLRCYEQASGGFRCSSAGCGYGFDCMRTRSSEIRWMTGEPELWSP